MKKKICYIVIQGMVLLHLLVISPEVHAENAAALSFTTPATTIDVQENITLSAVLDTGGYSNVMTVETYITFDPQFFSLVGDIDVDSQAFPFRFKKEINQESGYIDVSVSNVVPQAGSDILLVTFTLRALQSGTSSVSFDTNHSAVLLSDTANTNVLGNIIPLSVTIEGEKVENIEQDQTNINVNFNSNVEPEDNTDVLPESTNDNTNSDTNNVHQDLPEPIGEYEPFVLHGTNMNNSNTAEPPLPVPNDNTNNLVSDVGINKAGDNLSEDKGEGKSDNDLAISSNDEVRDAGIIPVYTETCLTPTNIKVEKKQDTVLISWDKNDPRVEEYIAHYSIDSHQSVQSENVKHTTNFMILGLQPGEKYHLALSATGSCLESSLSADIVITSHTPRVRPQNLASTAGTGSILHETAPVKERFIPVWWSTLLFLSVGMGIVIFWIKKVKV